MRIKKMIPVFSSDKTLCFQFPKSWSYLSQKQLKTVLVLLSTYQTDDALVRIVCFFANILIVRRLQNGNFLCRLFTNKGEHSITLSADEFMIMCDALQWVLVPGNSPVLFDVYKKRKSLNKQLIGVPFETFIILDNLYQGYIISSNKEAVVKMANIIFEGNSNIKSLPLYMLYGIVLWFTQLKRLFAEEFPNFFRPTEDNSSASIKEAMNAQIRALTAGDVTKEKEVLAIGTWRALTELDAKAKEIEEFKKSMRK